MDFDDWGVDGMDAIAVIHWTDSTGFENKHFCYDSESMNGVIGSLKSKNYCFYVVMLSVHAKLPRITPKRHRVGA